MWKKNKNCLVVTCQVFNMINIYDIYDSVVMMYFLLKWGCGPQSRGGKPNSIYTPKDIQYRLLEYYLVIDCIYFMFRTKNE